MLKLKRKNYKGFTLIELLVVISIIGLLASIVFISLGPAREKARMAKGLQFEASVYHALGAYAIGIWNFDGKTANDSSGNGNDGTINGGVAWSTEGETANGKGYALSFDGDTSDYVEITSANGSLHEDFSELSISVWVKPNFLVGSAAVHRVIDKRNGSNLAFRILADNAGHWRFQVRGSGNGGGADNCDIAGLSWDINTWHLFTATYDGTDMKCYWDSNLETTKPHSYGGDVDNAIGVTYIGTNAPDHAYGPFNGGIDEVRIYAQALSQAQIRQIYVEGAKRFNLTIK